MPVELLEIYEDAYSDEKEKWDSLEEFASQIRAGLESKFSNAMIQATVHSGEQPRAVFSVDVLHEGTPTASVELALLVAYHSGIWMVSTPDKPPADQDMSEVVELLDKRLRQIVRTEARRQAAATEPSASPA